MISTRAYRHTHIAKTIIHKKQRVRGDDRAMIIKSQQTWTLTAIHKVRLKYTHSLTL